MSTAAAIMRLGSDAWNAELYNSLSFTSHIAAAIKSRTVALSLAISLRRLVSKLEWTLESAHLIVEGKLQLPEPDEPATPARMHNGIDTLQMISRILSSTYESARRRRLTNNSLLATPLLKLPKLADEFSELADWVEMVGLESKSIDDIFDRARAEKEHGDIYDLTQVD